MGRWSAAVLAACCILLGMHAVSALPREKASEEYPLPEVKKNCSICHLDRGTSGPGALKKKLSDLCADCHADRMASKEHKVGIVPSGEVKGLPLTDGRMTCFTCHDPHQNAYGTLLRRKQTELCLICHPK